MTVVVYFGYAGIDLLPHLLLTNALHARPSLRCLLVKTPRVIHRCFGDSKIGLWPLTLSDAAVLLSKFVFYLLILFPPIDDLARPLAVRTQRLWSSHLRRSAMAPAMSPV